MTMPPEEIQVTCPACSHTYDDWYRPSINLSLDDFDEEYLRKATTATCPKCRTVVELGVLVVGREGTWRMPGRSGTER